MSSKSLTLLYVSRIIPGIFEYDEVVSSVMSFFCSMAHFTLRKAGEPLKGTGLFLKKEIQSMWETQHDRLSTAGSEDGGA